MNQFEQFIQNSPDYINLRFQYGNQLFIQENGVYKIQAVRLAHEVWEKFESRDRASDVVIKLHYNEIIQLKAEDREKKDFMEMALISLNHLKENAVTHRDYGHECNWIKSFDGLIKLATDAEDALKEALRGKHDAE